MRQSRKLPFCAAALLAAACLMPAVSGAQSLSLSYKLESSKAASEPRTPPIVSRCSGLAWAAALVSGCARELRPAHDEASVAIAGTAGPGEYRREAVARRAETTEPASAARDSSATSDLPALGSPAYDGRLLRIAGGKDALTAAARSVDLMFRFGTKYRMRSGDTGLEVYKFLDVTQENRLQTGGLKNLAVELLFPFQ